MRLIDADELFKAYEKIAWYNNADRDEIAEEVLLQMPTVDAVPVVRCKDCKFWFRNNGHDKNGCPITDSDIWMDDSGFCSYGERRDDAENH